VNKSLVLLEEAGAEAERGRYRLLEMVRQYGWERVTAGGEVAALRDRHLAWCVALAEEAAPGLKGPEQVVWLGRLEIEHDNLRAALRWAQEAGAQQAGLRLVGAVWRFWYMCGHLSEGRSWLEGLLVGVGAWEPVAREPTTRAKALNGAGVLAWAQGDYARATVLHEESLALRRELGDKRGIADSLTNLGAQAWAQGDYARATVLHEESLALYQELGDKRGIATSLTNLGAQAWAQGDYARALALYEESLALFQALGDKYGIAVSLNNLGLVAQRRGEHGRAATLHVEALHLGCDIGAKDLVARGLECLACVAAAHRQPQRAAWLGGAAETLREALGMPQPPDERSDHERAVGAMRAALGEEVLAATWAEGRALPLAEAIALVLESGEVIAPGSGAATPM
jgi:non-specific serine/threonine protein kinase